MKKQITAVLTFAVALFLILSLLPKSVVDNEKETVGEVVEEQKEVVEEQHLEISKNEKQRLDSLKSIFSTTKDRTVFDSIISLYVANNLIDSAARFAESNLTEAASWKEKKRVGDLYFDAFTFAFENEQATRWGQKSREYYEEVLKSQPDSLNLRVKVGLTLVSSEMPMRGILMIREVAEQNPENTMAIRSLGMLSIQSKQFDKAIGRFERLLELNPNDLEAAYYLGVSQHELGQEEDAMRTFEEIRNTTADESILQAIDSYLGTEHKEH